MYTLNLFIPFSGLSLWALFPVVQSFDAVFALTFCAVVFVFLVTFHRIYVFIFLDAIKNLLELFRIQHFVYVTWSGAISC